MLTEKALDERIRSLRQSCDGATTPEDMGTTGLIAWVIMRPTNAPDIGGTRAYQRFSKALAIIRRRGKGAHLFAKAVLKEVRAVSGRWNVQRFEQYANTLTRND